MRRSFGRRRRITTSLIMPLKKRRKILPGVSTKNSKYPGVNSAAANPGRFTSNASGSLLPGNSSCITEFPNNKVPHCSGTLTYRCFLLKTGMLTAKKANTRGSNGAPRSTITASSEIPRAGEKYPLSSSTCSAVIVLAKTAENATPMSV